MVSQSCEHRSIGWRSSICGNVDALMSNRCTSGFMVIQQRPRPHILSWDSVAVECATNRAALPILQRGSLWSHHGCHAWDIVLTAYLRQLLSCLLRGAKQEVLFCKGHSIVRCLRHSVFIQIVEAADELSGYGEGMPRVVPTAVLSSQGWHDDRSILSLYAFSSWPSQHVWFVQMVLLCQYCATLPPLIASI